MTTPKHLIFGAGNAKLPKDIATFSLPAGHTCPGALLCMARANKQTGTITDGKDQQFRCYAASAESMYPAVRKARWHNFDSLKNLTREGMVELITRSLPEQPIVRVHVSGDFFSETYFLAWLDVARNCHSKRFYAYTKSIHLWVRHRDLVPENFILTASRGGRYDALAEELELKSALVVFSVEQARALSLAIDHDDSHAYNGTENFALLLHGQQPKGSKASAALKALNGMGSYSAKKTNNQHEMTKCTPTFTNQNT